MPEARRPMSFPVRDTLDIATEQPARPQPLALVREGLAPAPVIAAPDDLDRLQSCLDWLNRERMLLALETTERNAPRHLPRAAQLAPVAGISALEILPPDKLPPAKPPALRQERLPFVLSPPLASDRLQPPHPRRAHFPGTMLVVLIAAAIAGAVAYHATVVAFPLPSIAQAASFETP
jgi:hypothetical protein